MSEENKKDVEKPQEITEKKVDANAEAGPCTLITNASCGINNMCGCGRTTRGGCGSISNCGMQNSWSN